MMTKADLNNNEYNPYYQAYIQRSGSQGIIDSLVSNGESTATFFEAIPEERLDYRYAEGKWTIKEILQHLIDTERIFSYRALCLTRKDKTTLPGYDQDSYVRHAKANRRSFADLINEYRVLRALTIILFRSFDEQMLLEIGTVSNSNLSVRAIGFIITGHEVHHCDIIKERYL